ncbi:hypothetical protein C8R46DRAFT_845303, partial [Mycena filopes]
MVNSMSTKMEIGSPMACMYLLGHPDNYPSHKFANFAWRSYIVGASIVDDYTFRPLIYSNINLYEWIQCHDKKELTNTERQELLEARRNREAYLEDMNGSDRDVRHLFIGRHKQRDSHGVSCDFSRLETVIPNFMGGAIPRADRGDREYYCMSIMTLFKPWRLPEQLKDQHSTWDQTFVEHIFTARQTELLNNFNLRYECNDARDDH